MARERKKEREIEKSTMKVEGRWGLQLRHGVFLTVSLKSSEKNLRLYSTKKGATNEEVKRGRRK